jgi:hypothetical protein
MATSIDVYLDKSGGLLSAGSAANGSLPTFTRNDNYNFRLRVLERNSGGSYTDTNLSGPSFKLGIGKVGQTPNSGQFKLVLNSVTSNAISYNATTTEFLNAISGIAGQVTVESYGTTSSGWLITSATANTSLSFSGVTYTLFPISSVLVNTRRLPDASISAQQTIELSRSPAVFSDSFTTITGDGVALNNLQAGSSTKNQTYELTVSNDVYGGSFSLGFSGYSINAPYNSAASDLQTLLTAITGIGTGNISVQSNNSRGYIIAFINELGLQPLTTSLLLDAGGINTPTFYQTTVTMSTVQLDEIFIEDASQSITPTMEIEISEGGRIKTLYQGIVTIVKDLITAGNVVPAPSPQYYTKAEVDSTFIKDLSTNISATNRALYSASSQKSVDYGNRVLTDSSNTNQLQWSSSGVTIGSTLFVNSNINLASVAGTKIGTTTSQKLGFFGVAPVVQPTDSNAISCLAQLGLLKDATTTYGVFPNSSKTLSTTASIWFNGSIAQNDFHSVTRTVTGSLINDVVLLGLPSEFDGGLSIKGCVVSANVVSITALNATNSPINQTTATYRITVIGY